MNTDMLQSIYAHASWANRKLFDTAAELTERQLIHAAVGSETIFDLLVHLVDVQRTWLARAQYTQTPHLDRAACSTLGALRELWERVDDATRMYVAGLYADDLANGLVVGGMLLLGNCAAGATNQHGTQLAEHSNRGKCTQHAPDVGWQWGLFRGFEEQDRVLPGAFIRPERRTTQPIQHLQTAADQWAGHHPLTLEPAPGRAWA
jgi:DinB family